MNKKILPIDIEVDTELDIQYRQEFYKVTTGEEFERFLHRWSFWIDSKFLNLTKKEWEIIKLKIGICRNKLATKKDIEKCKDVLDLLVPNKILRYTIIAYEYKVPWGTAFIQMNKDDD